MGTVKGPGRNDPCPCGSGNKAKRCCMVSGGWLKPLANCSPSPPATGQSEPKCFARAFGDCGGGISGEHFISKDILDSFSGVVVSGFPWQEPSTEKRVGINALVANVLCARHNSALSPLDAEAGRFFRTLREFDRGLRVAEPHKEDDFVLFCGEDLERWLLKLLCGLLASGNASVGGERVRVDDLDQSWLDLLFAGAVWPPEAGLYFVYPEDGRFWAYDSVGTSLLTAPTGEVMGVRVDVAGFSLALCVVKPNLDNSTAFAGGVYRPRELRLRSGAVVQTGWLSWADRSQQRWIELTRTGEYDGTPPR